MIRLGLFILCMSLFPVMGNSGSLDTRAVEGMLTENINGKLKLLSKNGKSHTQDFKRVGKLSGDYVLELTIDKNAWVYLVKGDDKGKLKEVWPGEYKKRDPYLNFVKLNTKQQIPVTAQLLQSDIPLHLVFQRIDSERDESDNYILIVRGDDENKSEESLVLRNHALYFTVQYASGKNYSLLPLPLEK